MDGVPCFVGLIVVTIAGMWNFAVSIGSSVLDGTPWIPQSDTLGTSLRYYMLSEYIMFSDATRYYIM